MKVSSQSLAGCAAAAATLSASQHQPGHGRDAEVLATVGGFARVAIGVRHCSDGDSAGRLFVSAVQVLAEG